MERITEDVVWEADETLKSLATHGLHPLLGPALNLCNSPDDLDFRVSEDKRKQN